MWPDPLSRKEPEPWRLAEDTGEKKPARTMPLTGVAGTAEVAARGKLAAVRAGYYSDPYAECFVTGECTRPGPLINRGHHLRVAVIQSVVSQFLDAVGPREAQIISLGAGFDTRFWTLSADADSRPGRYIELDQAEVVERKAALIAARPSLLAALPEGSRCVGPSGVASRCGYHLAAADVRQPAELEAALSAAGWEPAAPTLVLAECCLVYLPAPASAALLAWFASRSRCAAFLAYEQIRPDDAFGRTMLENLRRRGIPLLGLRDCPDLAAQVARCEAAGWGRAEAEDLLQLYGRAVTARERARLARLERWRPGPAPPDPRGPRLRGVSVTVGSTRWRSGS